MIVFMEENGLGITRHRYCVCSETPPNIPPSNERVKKLVFIFSPSSTINKNDTSISAG